MEEPTQLETSSGARERMPGWVPRAILLFYGVSVLLFVGYWVVQKTRDLLIMLLVSLFLSFALEPAVDWLDRRGIRRGPGTLISFLGLFALVGLFVFAIGQLLTDQVVTLVDRAPGYITTIEGWASDTFGSRFDTDEVLAEFRDGGRIGQLATSLADNILTVGAAVVGVMFQLLTVLLFTFYLVADGPRLRRVICSMLPPERQVEVLRVWELGIDKTGGYLYSRTLLALASTAFHWFAFAVVGIPSPLALALWVGVLSQFVPVIGTYLSGVLPVLIALVDASPAKALWVLGSILVYQQIENYLLAPRVTAQTMDLHPAVAFGSVIAGAGILGPIGALLALPVAATAQAFISTYVQRHVVIESSLVFNVPRPTRPAQESDKTTTGGTAPTAQSGDGGSNSS